LSAANTKLEHLTRQDGLTDLANRRYFDAYLADQIAIARRQRRSLALVLCDVDAFKAYNDFHGHVAGDECLRQIAAALKTCCRRPADLAARYGGEEFALILPDTDLKGALKIAECVREAVAQLHIAHMRSPAGPFVSVSGGVSASAAVSIFTADQLIVAADRALYQAKRDGRNQMAAMLVEAA
jgi:diguanylate cyclase (GGDEF)-like protein